MDDTGMWKNKYNTGAAEINKIQDYMKMGPIKIGEHLVKMHEAYKHLPGKNLWRASKRIVTLKRTQYIDI